MRQTWAIGILILIAMLAVGCNNESERLSRMAERTVRSQNEVNANVTRANEKFVELNKEIQLERRGLQDERLKLNSQFEGLEQDRRDLHQERRSELAWSESFKFLAIVIAAIMPLFLCAYLIWAATRSSVEHEELNAILLRELASAEPRLIAAPNLPRIADRHERNESDKKTNETSTKRRNQNVSRRKNRDTDPRC